MLSVVGEEYMAFSESVKGQYTPLIAIHKYDGTLSYRDIIKEDLLRIHDDQTVPGGWVFRKSQNTTSSWVKRFALVRGQYLFFFHSPQNEKPIAVVPLDDCNVIVPDLGNKTFDEMRTYKANEGFEFDIRHNSRATVRLYTVSESERTEWVHRCKSRIEAHNIKRMLEPSAPPPVASSGNIFITSTKLTGLSLLPALGAAPNALGNLPGTAMGMQSRPPQRSSDLASVAGTYLGAYGGLGGAGPGFGGQYGLMTGISSAASVYGGGGFSSGASVLGNASAMGGARGLVGNTAFSNAAGFNRPSVFTAQTNNAAASNTPAPYSPQGTNRKNGSVGSLASGSGSTVAGGRLSAHAQGINKFRTRKDLGYEFMVLEENLKKRLADQLEARNREQATKQKLYSKEFLAECQEKEEANPLTLAELFRLSLCFIDEEIAEDAQAGTQLQMPHLKGQAIEEMLITVYRKYCGDSGFMSLEQFIEFFEDSAILHTHAPHNDNDEPIEEFVTLLDPIRLLTLVPRNIGFSVAEAYDIVNEKLLAATKNDKFIINFSQFYVILLRVTQIVYADLFKSDATVAFNKLLQEIICPMYVWCKAYAPAKYHSKRGSKDVLVLEERILLLMTTYAPNLYRVFLSYGHDAVGKVPEIDRPFPESAQINERGMFKLPGVAPQHQADNNAHITADSVFVTESGCLRFARDYGITPYVLSNKAVREIYRAVNRQKVIVSSRLPTRDMLQNKIHSAAQISNANKKKDPPPMRFISKANPGTLSNGGAGGVAGTRAAAVGGATPTGFGSSSAKHVRGVPGVTNVAITPKKGSGKSPTKGTKAAMTEGAGGSVSGGEEDESPPPPAPPALDLPSEKEKVIGGLGFSEFIEFLAHVAVEGMNQQENYDIVFPTPFSKVLAILTVWGVADLRKLEEVRIIHTEENYQ